MPQAGASTASGNANQGIASNYWQQLTSGNRTAATQAVAPETASINAQSDAQKRQAAAMGTARGGGTAGADQQRATDTQAKIDAALLQARPDAAKNLAQLGTAQVGQGLQAADLSEKAAGDLTDASIKSRPTSLQANQDMQSQVASAIDAVFA